MSEEETQGPTSTVYRVDETSKTDVFESEGYFTTLSQLLRLLSVEWVHRGLFQDAIL